MAIPLNQGLFLFGLSLTTPGHAALLYAMTPIFVFVLALLRREERSSPWKTVGHRRGLRRARRWCWWRAASSPARPDGDRALVGDLLVLLAVISWAVYAVWGQALRRAVRRDHHHRRDHRLGQPRSTCRSGSLFSRAASFRALSPAGWGSVAYLVVLTSVVSYLLYYWALAREDASRVAIWSNTQPVLTALLAWAVYGDPLTPSFVAGGVLVIVGRR